MLVGVAVAGALGAVVALGTPWVWFAFGLVLCLVILSMTEAVPSFLFLALALVFMLTVDASRSALIRPWLTASGAATLGLCILGAVTLLAGPPDLRTWRSAIPLLFLVAVGLLWQLAGVRSEGLQAIATLALLAETMLVTATAARQQPGVSYRLVGIGLTACGAAVGLAYTMQELLSPSARLLGPRAVASLLAICLSWTAPHWRAGSRRHGYVSVFLALVIGLSLSRTAIAVSLMTLGSSWLMGRRKRHLTWRRSIGVLVAAAILAAGALVILVRAIDPLRERFAVGDVVAVEGVRVNVMGRDDLWRATWRSAMASPLIGHGPGSARLLIRAVAPGLDHPHNDYLRLVHDYGLLGIALWGAFVLSSLRLVGRGDWEMRRTGPLRNARWSAVLALVAFSLLMLTDNVLVYPFVVLPLGLIVGLAVGLRTSAGPVGAGTDSNACQRGSLAPCT